MSPIKTTHLYWLIRTHRRFTAARQRATIPIFPLLQCWGSGNCPFHPTTRLKTIVFNLKVNILQQICPISLLHSCCCSYRYILTRRKCFITRLAGVWSLRLYWESILIAHVVRKKDQASLQLKQSDEQYII